MIDPERNIQIRIEELRRLIHNYLLSATDDEEKNVMISNARGELRVLEHKLNNIKRMKSIGVKF